LVVIEEQIVLFLENLLQSIGWAGIVVAMAIESACIPLPSEVTMPLAGWMLVQARGLQVGLQLWKTIVASDLSHQIGLGSLSSPSLAGMTAAILLGGFYGGLGCTIGSVITYWLGALGGRPILEKYGRYVLISQHDIELADRWFNRYGEYTAFFSRLLPIIRTFISLPLGMARVNFLKFTLLTFIGSSIWSGALAWAGFLFGEHWREVRELMRPFDIPIAIILLALVALFFYRHLKRSREEATTPLEEGRE
jgi:membrane protein DedA with SNARE-associated domain